MSENDDQFFSDEGGGSGGRPEGRPDVVAEKPPHFDDDMPPIVRWTPGTPPVEMPAAADVSSPSGTAEPEVPGREDATGDEEALEEIEPEQAALESVGQEAMLEEAVIETAVAGAGPREPGPLVESGPSDSGPLVESGSRESGPLAESGSRDSGPLAESGSRESGPLAELLEDLRPPSRSPRFDDPRFLVDREWPPIVDHWSDVPPPEWPRTPDRVDESEGSLDVPDVSDIPEVSDVPEVSDIREISDVADVSDIADFPPPIPPAVTDPRFRDVGVSSQPDLRPSDRSPLDAPVAWSPVSDMFIDDPEPPPPARPTERPVASSAGRQQDSDPLSPPVEASPDVPPVEPVAWSPLSPPVGTGPDVSPVETSPDVSPVGSAPDVPPVEPVAWSPLSPPVGASPGAPPVEPELWSPLPPPAGESAASTRQWQEAPRWGSPPAQQPAPPLSQQSPDALPPTASPSAERAWGVPARRHTHYDGPMYTSTGEIRELVSIDTSPPPAQDQRRYEPPVHPPLSSAGRGSVTLSAASKSGVPWGRLTLIAAVLVLSAGAVFAVRQALRSPAGPASPDEAAERMLIALENDDLLGVIELWSPAEREAIFDPTVETLVELDRVEGGGDEYSSLLQPGDGESGLLADNLLRLEDVTYEIETLGPGVGYLVTTGGTLIGQGDPDSVPEWLNGLAGGEPSAEDLHTEVDLADDPIRLALVEEDGSWYFSLFYSVAEDLRRDAGRAAPGFDGERLAVGADEPKEAVEEMFKSLIELDFIVALNRLDPVEFEALYDYRELLDPTIEELMDDAGQTADEAGATWELTRLITSSNEIRGRTTVGVELIEATITAEGAFMNLSMQDGCLVVERRDETGTETTNTCELSEELAAELPPDTPDWLLNDRTQFNIRVVERNGRWYVSGWPSMIGNLADQLAELSPAEWQDRKDFYADLIDGLAVDGLPNLESQGF